MKSRVNPVEMVETVSCVCMKSLSNQSIAIPGHLRYEEIISISIAFLFIEKSLRCKGVIWKSSVCIVPVGIIIAVLLRVDTIIIQAR